MLSMRVRSSLHRQAASRNPLGWRGCPMPRVPTWRSRSTIQAAQSRSPSRRVRPIQRPLPRHDGWSSSGRQMTAQRAVLGSRQRAAGRVRCRRGVGCEHGKQVPHDERAHLGHLLLAPLPRLRPLQRPCCHLHLKRRATATAAAGRRRPRSCHSGCCCLFAGGGGAAECVCARQQTRAHQRAWRVRERARALIKVVGG